MVRVLRNFSRIRFEPSRESARHSRRRLNLRLLESLNHIFERVGCHLACDEVKAERLANYLQIDGKASPELFGHYFALVEAVNTGDLEEVQACLDAVLNCPLIESKPLFVDLYNSITPASEVRILGRHFDFSDGVECQLKLLESTVERPALEQMSRALRMLRVMAPYTWTEMNDVVTRFVLVGASQNREGYTFDGASSLEQWGTVLINAEISKSDLELCETLAHESAHCSLFAMSPWAFLVKNPDNERYTSPLRHDPRPLDGIYHATFVLGRMHYAINEMHGSGLLDQGSESEAVKLMERSKANFDEGYSLLAKHAVFTEEGRSLMEAAFRYMSSSPSQAAKEHA